MNDSIDAAGEVDTFRLDTGNATTLRLTDVTGEMGASVAGSLRITLPGRTDSPGFTVTSNYQFTVRPGAPYTLTVGARPGNRRTSTTRR
ncbi:hypothetical protein [Streptomyces peucetius]|nr:hypothetical protein CGZ69_00700 [Streptomyces peucetius subsp. caesius ATCC 27952]